MFTYTPIDPVAIALGPLKVQWYGLMYLLGFLAFWLLGKYRSKRADSPLTADEVGDFLFYGALGVILGGRIGYVLFYGLDAAIADPLSIFRTWEGGMSFHGGFIGVLVAGALFARKVKTDFLKLSDFVIPFIPLGLMAGRIGNFINGELWGRPTEGWWGVVFTLVDDQPRHASMLYEAALEGLVLFLILWFYSRKPRNRGAVTGLFMIGYGVFRFMIEFARQPDAHIGFVAFDWMSMGQVLCLPMILVGTLIFLGSRRTSNKVEIA